MIDRQKRLIEVYNHLRNYCGVHTKTQFAELLGYGRTSLSAAMNGNLDYLTDSLFNSICNRWPGIFNIDYLVNGDGTLLYDKKPDPVPSSQEPIDHSSLVNALIAAKDETIDALHRELDAKNLLIEKLQAELNDIKYRADRPAMPYSNFIDQPLVAAEPDPQK